MLKHGENIVDLLGAEVDRIETELKVGACFSILEARLIMFFVSFTTSKNILKYVMLIWRCFKMSLLCCFLLANLGDKPIKNSNLFFNYTKKFFFNCL